METCKWICHVCTHNHGNHNMWSNMFKYNITYHTENTITVQYNRTEMKDETALSQGLAVYPHDPEVK